MPRSWKRLKPKSRARVDYLAGQAWESDLFSRSVLCTDEHVQDLDSGEVLLVLDSDDAVEDVWDDYKQSLGSPFDRPY